MDYVLKYINDDIYILRYNNILEKINNNIQSLQSNKLMNVIYIEFFLGNNEDISFIDFINIIKNVDTIKLGDIMELTVDPENTFELIRPYHELAAYTIIDALIFVIKYFNKDFNNKQNYIQLIPKKINLHELDKTILGIKTLLDIFNNQICYN